MTMKLKAVTFLAVLVAVLFGVPTLVATNFWPRVIWLVVMYLWIGVVLGIAARSRKREWLIVIGWLPATIKIVGEEFDK